MKEYGRRRSLIVVTVTVVNTPDAHRERFRRRLKEEHNNKKKDIR